MITHLCPSGHTVLLDDEDRPPGRVSIGSHGYPQLWNGQTVVLLHRWLFGLEVGDSRQVDHINRNKLDNRRANLRVVTPAQNSQNVPRPRRNAYLNHSGRWQAKVKINGKSKYLGTFDDPEEAASVAAEYRSRHMTYAT